MPKPSRLLRVLISLAAVKLAACSGSSNAGLPSASDRSASHVSSPAITGASSRRTVSDASQILTTLAKGQSAVLATPNALQTTSRPPLIKRPFISGLPSRPLITGTGYEFAEMQGTTGTYLVSWNPNDANCTSISWSVTQDTVPKAPTATVHGPSSPGQWIPVDVPSTSQTALGVYTVVTKATCNDGGSVNVTAQMAVLQLALYDAAASMTATITNTTITRAIGDAVQPQATFLPSNLAVPVQSVAWTVPDGTYDIYDYVRQINHSAQTSSGTVYGIPLSWNPTQVIALKGETGSLKAAVQNSDVGPVTAQFMFKSIEPSSVNITASIANPVAIYTASPGPTPTPEPYLSLGDASLGKPGIKWTFSAAAPSGYKGQLDMIQLINSSRTGTTTGNQTTNLFTTNNQSWLDSCELYDSAVAIGSTWSDNDSPAQHLSATYIKESATDQFQSYMIYEPNAIHKERTIWVPLGDVTWSWSGVANYSNGWTLGSSSAQRWLRFSGQQSPVLM